jgi:hypothetical protein
MSVPYLDGDDEDLPLRNPVYSELVAGVPDRSNLASSLRRGLLDLDRPDLGHPEIPDLWERLRDDKRPMQQRGLYCPDCYEKDPEHPEWMYLRLRNGRRESAHFNRGHKSHAERPEHIAFKERIARAAEEGGFQADLEVSTRDRAARLDVRIIGERGKVYGVEPQLSREPWTQTARRDRARRKNKIMPVWHVVSPYAELIDHTQFARTDNLPPEAIRNSRDLLVRGGIKEPRWERCDSRNPLPCPVKGRGRCGGLHADWEVLAVQLDDFVRDVASGVFVPVAIKGQNRIVRFWARAADRDRYLDAGGEALEETGTPRAVRVPMLAEELDREALCTRKRPSTYTVTRRPPRDTGEAVRPAVTLREEAMVLAGLPAHLKPLPAWFEGLSLAERRALAGRLGCWPHQIAPCSRCSEPAVQRQSDQTPLCAACRA